MLTRKKPSKDLDLDDFFDKFFMNNYTDIMYEFREK